MPEIAAVGPILLAKEKIVDSNSSGTKLRNYLVREFRQELFIRADVIAALRQKRVHVNGSIVLDSYLLKEGDHVQVEVDAAQVIKSRLHSLDVKLKYAEDGLAILAKAPGVSRPDIEWAAPALLLISQVNSNVSGIEATDIRPWIAVNEVEKSVRSLIILVDSEKRRNTVAKNIASGQVSFGLCALCHGSAAQSKFDNISTECIAAKVNMAIDNNTNKLDTWLSYNRLPADIFDSVKIKIDIVINSSSVGNLSMVHGTVSRANKPSLVLRRSMFELGNPVVGSQNYSQPLSNHRDKGTLLAIVRVELPSLADISKRIVVSEGVPSKLLAVCERESKFHRLRQEKAHAEIEQFRSTDNPLTTDDDSTELGVELIEGKPAAYISGLKQFCSYTFNVTPDTLIPRASTEVLAQAVLKYLDSESSNGLLTKRFMDLGTGSGCILLSVLLQTCHVQGIGIDISKPALEVSRRNCELHGMLDRTILLQSSFKTFTLDPQVLSYGPYDFIACNPPYISTKKASQMRATIEHEPHLALIAQDGGYQAYRDICKSLEANLSILRPSACIGFEIGKNMEKGVRRIFCRWQEVGAFNDAHGFLRVIIFQRPSSIASNAF
ncbi:S-adenosyl-L-methionine-dependent methyltransferase [Coemansia spiralis]|nr:S-adenosyl-L-methionine-dependent methyltransferase [Coemansia spiralis]